ncbi:unnamed protein product [Closterium sp. Naga37s-1]|nr:unnamed protein product [Closterium sp. Naga37s-1]
MHSCLVSPSPSRPSSPHHVLSLSALPQERHSNKGEFSRAKLKGKRAIELGAGCGLAGLGFALLGCDTVLTDEALVLPLLFRNVTRLQSQASMDAAADSFLGSVGSVEVAELWWGNAQHIAQVGPPFDAIVATDVVYVEDSVPALLATMLSLSHPRTPILLGYEFRSATVHDRLHAYAKQMFDVKKVPATKLHAEYQHPSIDVFIMKRKAAPILPPELAAMAGLAARHVSKSELREATGEEKTTTPLADEPSSPVRPLEEPLLRHSQGRNAEGGLRGEQQQQQQQQYEGLLPTLLWCCFACLGAFSFGYAVREMNGGGREREEASRGDGLYLTRSSSPEMGVTSHFLPSFSADPPPAPSSRSLFSDFPPPHWRIFLRLLPPLLSHFAPLPLFLPSTSPFSPPPPIPPSPTPRSPPPQVGYTSPALASLSADLRLSPALASLFSSLITVGAMLGAVGAGAVAEGVGRRGALALAALLLAAGWGGIALAQSLPLLLSSRVINGLGVGLASYVVPVYIAEVAPNAWRGALGSLNQLAITVGMLGVYSAGLALPWRPFAAFGALPAVALLLGVAAAPESPRWLARRGAGREEVLRVLLRLRGAHGAAAAAGGGGGGDGGGGSGIAVRGADGAAAVCGHQRPLVPSYHRQLCVGLMVLQQCAGINAIVFFAATIFRNAGFTNPNLPSFGIAAVQVLFTVCSALLLDRAGRRVLLLLSSSGMSLSCLLLGLSFYLPHTHHPFLPASSAPLLAFSGCMAYIVFFSMGMGGIPWIIMSEIIPAHMRSLAGSLVVLWS